MAAFTASFIFVVLAEMGDKTQLLAMSFAARYKAWQVLTAVFFATLLNHALAVALGHFLTTVIPLDIISFAAALSFIFFGLWTLRGDEIEGEDKRDGRFGPVTTVAVAFFLAEMGDKTQLATVSLAVEYRNMLHVLMGTTLGMVVADAVGILMGIVIRKNIPGKIVKWISAGIFMGCGFLGMHGILSARLNPVSTFSILALIGLGVIYAVRRIMKSNKGC